MKLAEQDLCLYVNGERVPEDLVLDEARKLRELPFFQQIGDPALRESQIIFAAEHGAVDRVLVKQAAATDRIPLRPEEMEEEFAKLQASGGCRANGNPAELIGRVEAQARFARVIRKLAGEVPAMPDGVAEEFFQANPGIFQVPETVEVSHIVKNTGEGLPEVEARNGLLLASAALTEGEDFAAVARRFSDCPEGGGRLPPFARGAMVPEFEDVVFALECGQISPLFRTPFGWHIATLHARQAPRRPSFEEVRAEVEAMIAGRMEQLALRESLDRLRAGARITRGGGSTD